jgi:hypothetical protein
MALGAALRAVLTRFNFEMDGNKLGAINVAAAKTAGRFNKASTSAEILQQRLDGVFQKAKMLAGGLLAGLGVKALTADFAQNAVHADRMSGALGVSIEFFTGFQHALAATGAEGEGAGQVIADITERMFDAGHGSKALADDFGQLGFTTSQLKELVKDPEKAVLGLADAIQQAGAGSKRTFAVMSGLGDTGRKLIPLLELGSEGIKKLMADAQRLGVVLDKDAVKQAKIFNKRMVEMKARLRGARNAIAMRLLPAVNDMVAAFSVWIGEGDNATKMLYALAVAAGVAAVAIASMLAPKVTAAFRLFIGQLKAIVTLLRTITLQAALARIKLLAMVAGLVFIGLVIEDLVNFVRGDKSVTEQLFGRSQVVIDGLLSIRDTFMDMLDQVSTSFGELWGSIVMLAGAFGIRLTSFKALIKTIGKLIFMFIVAALIAVGNVLSAILWAVGKLISLFAKLIRLIVDVLLAVVNELKNAFRDLADLIDGIFTRIEDAAFVTANRIAAFFRRAADLAKSAWRGFARFLDRVKEKAAGLVGKLKEKLGITKVGIEVPAVVGAGAGPGGKPGGGVVTGNVVNVSTTVNAAPGQNEEKIGEAVNKGVQGTITRTLRDLQSDTGLTTAPAFISD